MTAGGTANGDRRGAYGLTVTGLSDARRLLQPSPAAWPSFRVDVRVGEPESVVTRWGPHHAEISLLGGGVSRMKREPLTAVLTLPEPPGDEAVVHPFMAGSSAVANWWLGRDTFHGGAFVVDGGAWAILADREMGKSSTLGWLAAHDVPILTDDLVVVDARDRVYAGPRCVDLREEAAAQLGVGEPLGLVGARHRWRHVVPEIQHTVPLQGWVLPAWGDGIEITEVSGATRVPSIAQHLMLRMVSSAERLLSLAAKPCLRFQRPRSWGSITPATIELLDRLAALPRLPTRGVRPQEEP